MSTNLQRTLPQLFETSAAQFAANIALWEKKSDAFKGTTYSELQISIHQCAAGLLSIGIAKGDRIALISEGRNDWVISELGMLYAGAVNVPLSVKLDELSDLKFRLLHSGCRMVIVSGGHAHKVRAIAHDLSEVEKIILLDGASQNDDEMKFSTLLEIGAEYLKTNRREFEAQWQSVHEHDAANICYTSGTTADPKGIILTHRNYTANIEQASSLLPIPQDYCSLLILPWDHSFCTHSGNLYAFEKRSEYGFRANRKNFA